MLIHEPTASAHLPKNCEFRRRRSWTSRINVIAMLLPIGFFRFRNTAISN
jgi:hypothetical protein